MKKIAIILAMLILIPLAASAQEKRVGVGFGHPNTVLTFSVDPFVGKIGYDFTSGEEFVFLGGSYTLINSRPFVGPFTASVGVGGFARLGFNDDEYIAGLNVPLTVELPLMDDFVEIFLEFDPGLELLPKPQFTFKSSCLWLGATLRLD